MRTSEDDADCATMTVEAAARRLGIGRMSAYRAAKRGEIPSIKIGGRILVLCSGLDALLRPRNHASGEEQVDGD